MRLAAAAALTLLLGASALAGSGGPKWLINQLRDTLSGAHDVDEFLTVYKGGQAIHVQSIGVTPFSPQLELYDGAGTLIGFAYAPPGVTHVAVTMPPGGTVTNILHLYVSGAGASSWPVYYAAWKGAP